MFTWADETSYDTDLVPLRAALPTLMTFSGWLDLAGRERLLAQLDGLPA